MAIPAHSRSAPDGVLFAALRAAALEAGRVIMKFYAEGCAVERKQDASPVTEADRAAEAVILSAIASAAPDIPVVAEEEASAGRLPVETGRRFLLVDPLDGTREFLARNGDFTVNIALIEDGRRHLMFGGEIKAGCPVHILQGMRDPDVPWRQAIKLVEHLSGDPVVLTLVKDGDHRLSTPADIARLQAAVAAVATAA